jgi:hypothetical protein
MVNADRVKKKIPSLLCAGDTSKSENNNVFMRNSYRLRQLQKRKPQKFNSLANQLCTVLEELDKEMTETVTTGETLQEKKPLTILFRPTERR